MSSRHDWDRLHSLCRFINIRQGGSFAKYVRLSFSSREQRRDHLLHVPNPLLWWIFGVRSRLRQHESDRLISLNRLVSGISNN